MNFFLIIEILAALIITRGILINILYKFGSYFSEKEEFQKSLSIFKFLNIVNPNDYIVLDCLGDTFFDLKEYHSAIKFYKKSLIKFSNNPETNKNLARAYLALSEWNEASYFFAAGNSLKRGIPWNEGNKDILTFEYKQKKLVTGLHKLKHDIEQFEGLVGKGFLPEIFIPYIEGYKELYKELYPLKVQNSQINLTTDQYKNISPLYEKNIYLIKTNKTNLPSINNSLNADTIQADFFEQKPNFVYFDDFLSNNSLEKIQNICLYSTIWNGYSKSGGYLGAYLDDGLDDKLFLQIAGELKRNFPKIFTNLPLTFIWAYKYDSELNGIEIHADKASINVNFWITPDIANLKPDCGGLILYDLETPGNWDFNQFNSNTSKIHNFIKEKDPKSFVIPYKCNRVVIFNSNLFHQTDNFYFDNRYENRRINITMLFG